MAKAADINDDGPMTEKMELLSSFDCKQGAVRAVR